MLLRRRRSRHTTLPAVGTILEALLCPGRVLTQDVEGLARGFWLDATHAEAKREKISVHEKRQGCPQGGGKRIWWQCDEDSKEYLQFQVGESNTQCVKG